MASPSMIWGFCNVFASIVLAAATTNVTVGFISNLTMSTLLDEIFTGYDRKLPPNYDKNGSDKNVIVVVDLFLNSLFAIREAEMDYSMSVYVRERWIDSRLKYTDVLNLTRLELDRTMFEEVWMPDLYIVNEKESDYHEVTVPNKMVHIYPDGTVQYSARVTGIFSCRMFLQNFPFDTQTCQFELESYGHSSKNLRLTWSTKAVTEADDVHLNNFFIRNIESYNCDKKYFGIEYSCVGVKVVFKRNYEYYIIQVYVPSVLIVILSWVSFWLDCTAVPARISLGLLTVLTMTTQSTSSREHLPRVSYLKAIDVYMATCLTFVFLGLVEFAYVNVLTRVEKRRIILRNTKEKEIKEINGKISPDSNSASDTSSSRETKQRGMDCFQRLSNLDRARLIDKISRVMFPLTFAIFNTVYLCIYFK